MNWLRVCVMRKEFVIKNEKVFMNLCFIIHCAFLHLMSEFVFRGLNIKK